MAGGIALVQQSGTRRFGRATGLVRALLRRPDGLIGLTILIFFAVIAIAPDLFVGPLQTAVSGRGPRLSPPTAGFPLGTDELRRDMVNLTVHGARVSMVIGLLATVITVLVGAVIGIVSGFVGGRLDAFLMRITDFFLVLPTFVLALILTPIIRDLIGSGSQEVLGIRMTLIVIVIVIGITSWSSTARIVRSPLQQLLQQLNREVPLRHAPYFSQELV
jgi:peptide/nickel transport system permease protein